MSQPSSTYDAVSLFSAGLDSILAAKVLMDQGLRVKCLHFVSPFFGKPHLLDHWRETYGLDIAAVDIGEEYVEMLRRPAHGYGKFLNPCVDCKILMMGAAKRLMNQYGARFIASGEVVGQRPMSQRRDALDIISRDSDTRGLLLRPLSAGLLEPTPMEEYGLVDRSRLPSIGGRGRKDQLALAEKFQLKEIPQPAGGCKLAEQESCRRYLPLLKRLPAAGNDEFRLSNVGRQLWAGDLWLTMGRNKDDNELLQAMARPTDILIDLKDFPGPLSLARLCEGTAAWTDEALRDAAALTASFSHKAVESGGPVEAIISIGSNAQTITVTPNRESALGFLEPEWSAAKKKDLPDEHGPGEESDEQG